MEARLNDVPSHRAQRYGSQTANTTAVFISLPTIGEDLNIEETKLQWIVSAYSLSSVSPLLSSLSVSDKLRAPVYGKSSASSDCSRT